MGSSLSHREGLVHRRTTEPSIVAGPTTDRLSVVGPVAPLRRKAGTWWVRSGRIGSFRFGARCHVARGIWPTYKATGVPAAPHG
jgi:hypothetical protein